MTAIGIARRWNRATLESRVADLATRKRHPGGSPNATEIAAYEAGLNTDAAVARGGRALVLGMTPELRVLALSRFERVVSVDSNHHSISLYRDWIPVAGRARETIIEADWFALSATVTQPVDAVLADGVFGNLPDVAAHRQLLGAIFSVLNRTGCFVTRMAMIPDAFNPGEYRADRLITRFRSGELDEAEFGFGMRLVGHHETCYDPPTGLLDNATIFARCEARHRAGELTNDELALIRRYYFGEVNCILAQREWERVLSGSGWDFKIHYCHGKSWYAYYPVYSCRPGRSPGTGEAPLESRANP